jgi:hypothetical protein
MFGNSLVTLYQKLILTEVIVIYRMLHWERKKLDSMVTSRVEVELQRQQIMEDICYAY